MVNSIIANENANKYSVGVSNFKSMGHNTRTFANKQTNKQKQKQKQKQKKTITRPLEESVEITSMSSPLISSSMRVARSSSAVV